MAEYRCPKCGNTDPDRMFATCTVAVRLSNNEIACDEWSPELADIVTCDGDPDEPDLCDHSAPLQDFIDAAVSHAAQLTDDAATVENIILRRLNRSKGTHE